MAAPLVLARYSPRRKQFVSATEGSKTARICLQIRILESEFSLMSGDLSAAGFCLEGANFWLFWYPLSSWNYGRLRRDKDTVSNIKR
jgi:hypothetical protein